MNKIKDTSLNRAVALRIMLIVGVALLVFIFAMVFIIMAVNRSSARNSARGHLIVLENYLEYSSDFNNLIRLTDGDLRITVMQISGIVIADSFTANIDILESRADRPEVISAIAYGEGQDIRRSETFRIDFLYMARVVEVDGVDIILRVAIPVASINNYLWPLVGIMLGLFVVMMVAVIFVTPKLSRSVTAPIFMIKQKLANIESNENTPIQLTKHDELNKVLIEIDEISEKLKSVLGQNVEEKQKLDSILANIDQGIVALDSSGQIISCNKLAEEFFCFNYTEPVAIEKIVRNISVLDNIKKAQEHKSMIFYDHTRANSEVFQVRFLPLAHDKISLIIAVQNVTDIRKTAKEKQEFFANAGHELNTPLSSIMGFSEIMLKDKKYNKAFVENIHKESLRMKILIEDMLRISELEENKEIIDAELDFKKIIDGVVNSATLRAKAKKITIKQNLTDAKIFANEEKITEVVTNLVENSIKYSGEGSKVEVTLTKEDNLAILKVEDNGIGIAQSDLSRIFERFYRVDKARTNIVDGTGLGLAIVKHICNHYNAQINVQSTLGKGTQITISFTAI